MGKRKFIASVIIVTLLVSMQVVSIAKANPFWGWVPGVVPSEPSQDKPILVIESPGNYSTCNESKVALDFTVFKPISWNHTVVPFGSCANGRIESVNVTLNGLPEFHDSLVFNDLNGGGSWNKSYSLNIEGLQFGVNSLEIVVSAHAFFINESRTDTDNRVSYSPMNATHALILISGFSDNSTVAPTLSPSAPTPIPSASPSPTLPRTETPTQTATIEPSLSSLPSQTPDRLQVKDFAPVIIPGSMILLAIVTVVLLIYFRKRRG